MHDAAIDECRLTKRCVLGVCVVIINQLCLPTPLTYVRDFKFLFKKKNKCIIHS